ncbi:hypothetical protein ANO11243_092190 [Dothideomycetidae sp. 11243]|nr:hypothetical protein ANO11243_092190 [fungal sp. No.11243]
MPHDEVTHAAGPAPLHFSGSTNSEVLARCQKYFQRGPTRTLIRYSPSSQTSPLRPTTRHPTMEGHCMCGAISIKVHDDELFTGKRRGHICHCRNCRYVAGGVWGANLAIEKDKVEIIGEEHLTQFIDKTTTSGTPMARCFCKHCGTPIKSVTPVMGNKIVIKMGCFDKVPAPEWEAFAVRRQEWEGPLEGCVQYKILGGPGKEQLK